MLLKIYNLDYTEQTEELEIELILDRSAQSLTATEHVQLRVLAGGTNLNLKWKVSKAMQMEQSTNLPHREEFTCLLLL